MLPAFATLPRREEAGCKASAERGAAPSRVDTAHWRCVFDGTRCARAACSGQRHTRGGSYCVSFDPDDCLGGGGRGEQRDKGSSDDGKMARRHGGGWITNNVASLEQVKESINRADVAGLCRSYILRVNRLSPRRPTTATKEKNQHPRIRIYSLCWITEIDASSINFIAVSVFLPIMTTRAE